MNWHEYFTYDDATGNLIWKARPHRKMSPFNAQYAGKVAGCKSINKKGRITAIMVLVEGQHIGAHRIVWEMHYGDIPEGKMPDHRDRDATNNRLSNLRLATYQENNRNRGIMRSNTSGVTGVFWETARAMWKAQIFVDGKNILLGRFRDIALAIQARKDGEAKYFKEFTAQAA